MTGTTTYDGFAPYDAAFVNGTTTTIVGGTYEKLYLANQAKVTITGVEIDTIDSCAITANNLGLLIIGEGTMLAPSTLRPVNTFPLSPSRTALPSTRSPTTAWNTLSPSG